MSLYPPSIILVRPQMGENIGATARAMMNFGLHDLRLVAPRDGWPNPKAHEMAARAKPIITGARLFPTLAEALSDCHQAYAVSARIREMTMPCYVPAQMQELPLSKPIALVFGPENNGLSNDDVALCHGLITIPTAPENPSLNLAQSVVILAYAWFQTTRAIDMPVNGVSDRQASIGEVEALHEALAAQLTASNFFSAPQKEALMRRNVRQMLTRMPLTSQDVQSLHGMLRILTAGS